MTLWVVKAVLTLPISLAGRAKFSLCWQALDASSQLGTQLR